MKNKFIFSGLLAVALTVMSFAPVSAIETNTLKARYTKAEGFVLPSTEAPSTKVDEEDPENGVNKTYTSSPELQEAFNAIYPNGQVPQGELVDFQDIQDFLAPLGMDTSNIAFRGNLDKCLLAVVDQNAGDNADIIIGAFRSGTVTIKLTNADKQEVYPLTFTVTPIEVNFTLTPANPTIKPGESIDILIGINPNDAWWIWFDDEGNSIDLSIMYEFAGGKAASFKELFDEEENFIGFTITGKNEGTATLSVKSAEGKYATSSTITVKKPTTPVKPETPASDDGEVLGESVSNKKPGVVQTSDNTNVILYSTALAASLIAIAGYTILRKKEN